MMLYPESQEERDALFAEAKKTAGLRKLEKMHKLYGATPGKKCGNCNHFFGKRFANVYYKCRLYGDTDGPGTDWRVKWDACGKFEEQS